MTDSGRVASQPGSHPTGHASYAVDGASRFDPSRLSDDAIIVAFGWFSFGAKASVTSNPPHANMKERQAALDELLAAKLITHEHESEPRYGIDRHHFRGTSELFDVLHSEHGQRVLAAALKDRTS